MRNFLLSLLPFKRRRLVTKLSKERVLKKAADITDKEYGEYLGGASDNGFTVAEKWYKNYGFGHSRNSFAPVANGRVYERDGETHIELFVRMNIIVLAFFSIFYIISAVLFLFGVVGVVIFFVSGFAISLSESLLLMVMLPIMLTVLQFAFKRPARRLIERLEELFVFE